MIVHELPAEGRYRSARYRQTAAPFGVAPAPYPCRGVRYERLQVLAAGRVSVRTAGSPGRGARILCVGAFRRRRLDRHHSDHRGHPPGPRVPRLQDQGQSALGAGDLPLPGQQRPRRIPGQLDAHHDQRHQAVRRERHGRDAARQPGGRQVHPGGSPVRLRRRPAQLRRYREVLRQAGQQDLRHRAGQRRQPRRPEHDRQERLRTGQVQVGGIQRGGHARRCSGPSGATSGWCSSAGSRTP